ncbi:MAG: hypothetical protein ACE5D1_06575 [Fidelibacterota bacterium]
MKISKYLILAGFCFGFAPGAQHRVVVPLSSKVGLTIDAEENRYYNIFPHIRGFESAQVFDEGNEKYTVRIVWLDQGRRRTTRRQLTLRQFIEMQNEIGSIAGRPGDGKLSDTTPDIPVNTILMTDLSASDHILIRPVKGWFFSGDVLSTDAQRLRVKTLWGERIIGVDELASVTVLDREYQGTRWWKIVYVGSGVIMIGIAELGSRVSGTSGDRLWYNRFLGFSAGLGVGLWVNQWVQFWILPHHEYNIRS